MSALVDTLAREAYEIVKRRAGSFRVMSFAECPPFVQTAWKEAVEYVLSNAPKNPISIAEQSGPSGADSPAPVDEVVKPTAEIDTTNKFLVAGNSKGVVIMRPPQLPMGADETLTLAAWLVCMAWLPNLLSPVDINVRFAQILAAVRDC